MVSCRCVAYTARSLLQEQHARKPRLFFWHQIILNCQATCSPCANTSHQLCKRCASTCSATIPPSRLQKFLHICHRKLPGLCYRTTCCPARPTCRLSIYILIKRAAASSASNLSRRAARPKASMSPTSMGKSCACAWPAQHPLPTACKRVTNQYPKDLLHSVDSTSVHSLATHVRGGNEMLIKPLPTPSLSMHVGRNRAKRLPKGDDVAWLSKRTPSKSMKMI